MEATELISSCVLAFVVVFVLLAVLALAMLLITALFPEREESLDASVIAALTSTVASIYPGARVIKIEEES